MKQKEAQLAPAARYCGKCNQRLTESNKDMPPRCYNRAACESRIKAKMPPETKQPLTDLKMLRLPPSETPMLLASKGISFEHMFNAVCTHFKLTDYQVKRLVNEKKEYAQYQRIRYITMYLAMADLGLPQEKAGACIERDRKTAAAAFHSVSSNMDKYAFDIQSIRKLFYPAEENLLT